MKKNVSVKIDGLFLWGTLAAVAGIFFYIKADEIQAAANKVNPASSDNFIYSGLSEVVKNSTGGESKDVGSAWYKNCKLSNFEPWYCIKP